MHRVFQDVLIFLVSFFFLSLSFSVIDADDSLENRGSYSVFDEETVDVPTWVIGDTWVYEADIYSDSEQGIFDVSSDDFRLTVTNLTSILLNNQTELAYEIELSAWLTGSFETDEISGDIQGDLEGRIYVRQADLSILQTNISSDGIIEWFLLDFDYELVSDASYLQPFEYFDFPIKTNESWNMSSTVQQESSFYVETFYDNQTSSTSSMNGTAFCDGVEIIDTVMGDFSSFHIISEGNGSIESWYNHSVKNVVKIFIDQSNDTASTLVNLNLNDYELFNQSVDFDVELDSAIASVDDQITVSGTVSDAETEDPLSFDLVDLFLPSTGYTDSVMTDDLGFFSFDVDVPLIVDHSPTTYDIGSDGIIVSMNADGLSGYETCTLTVIGIGITEMAASPTVQYETGLVTLSCMIYSVDPVIEAMVQVSGPSGFPPLNTSLDQINGHLYSYGRSYERVGSYSFRVWANDESGNSVCSQTKTFDIISDMLPPTIDGITVFPEVRYAHNPICFLANITDNVAVSQVQVNITHPDGMVFSHDMTESSDGYVYQQDFDILGEYSFFISAADPFNNTNQSAVHDFTIINDTLPPVIVDESGDFGILGEPFLFTAVVTDNAAVDRVMVSYNVDDDSVSHQIMDYISEDLWQYELIIPEDGSELSYYLTAVDTSNNSNMTVITQIPLLADEMMDVNQSLFDRGYRMMPGWDAAQEFTPSYSLLSRVDLYLSKFGVPTGDVTVQICEGSAGGTVLSEMVLSPDSVPSFPDYEWVTIDIDYISVTPGETYVIVLKDAAGADTHNCLQWGWCDSYPSGSGGPYDGGWFYFRKEGNPTWSPIRDWDFTFRIFSIGY